MLALLIEMALKVINLFTKYHVQYCPRGMLSFASSLLLYDRLRSAISLEYDPIYSVAEGMTRSGKWYDLWYQNYKNEKLSKLKGIWMMLFTFDGALTRFLADHSDELFSFYTHFWKS